MSDVALNLSMYNRNHGRNCITFHSFILLEISNLSLDFLQRLFHSFRLLDALTAILLVDSNFPLSSRILVLCSSLMVFIFCLMQASSVWQVDTSLEFFVFDHKHDEFPIDGGMIFEVFQHEFFHGTMDSTDSQPNDRGHLFRFVSKGVGDSRANFIDSPKNTFSKFGGETPRLFILESSLNGFFL